MSPTPLSLLNHLESELCAGDSKYRLDELKEYIPLCTECFQIVLPLVKMTYVYPPQQFLDNILVKKVATRINTILTEHSFTGKPLEYYIVPLRIPRIFPKQKEKFGVRHINGAYTYRNNRKIYVFRYEEWPKVALHEACHHLPFHTELWDNTSLMRIYRVFSIDRSMCPYDCTTKITPNEAVVEFWAEMLHLRFVSKEYAVPFNTLLQKEIQHALGKTAKILQHQTVYFPLWEEDTHAFSYVVLRTVLLFFHEAFKHIQYPYNSVTVTEFIISKFNDNRFQAALKSTPIPTTSDMRMTIFGDY